MVPLSLLALYHGWTAVQLATPAAHAREMLFGFALAVIAGYLLGPVPRRQLAVLVALWLLGRVGVLTWPGAVVASLADGAFALWVAGGWCHASSPPRSGATGCCRRCWA